MHDLTHPRPLSTLKVHLSGRLLHPHTTGRPQRRPNVCESNFDAQSGIPPWRGTFFGAPVASGAMTPEEAMRVALEEAALAGDEGEVPVGAVALASDAIVARRHNERERRRDPTAHAEMLALQDAARALGTWRLQAVTLVVTLEPCAMCAGALVAGRVGHLVFGAADPKAGACGSLYNLCADPRLNHELRVTPGVLAGPAGALLQSFFVERRA